MRVNAVYCIALGTENSGTVVSNIQKSSVTNTGFSLWQYDNNQYNVPCWWLMLGKQQWGIITCTTGREGEFIFQISFTTKCLSFIASASIPANLCTITTAKFTAHDMNYGVQYKDDVFGLFIGI